MKQTYTTMAKKQPNQRPPLTNEVIGALADAFNKSCLTIQRWVDKNDDRLTSEKAKQVFASKNITWN